MLSSIRSNRARISGGMSSRLDALFTFCPSPADRLGELPPDPIALSKLPVFSDDKLSGLPPDLFAAFVIVKLIMDGADV